MKKEKLILCDCDEVLSDCVNPLLDIVFQLTGERYKKDDMTKWDVLESIRRPDLSAAFHALCSKPGFCESFPILPGAQEGFEMIDALGTVIIVTSPMSVPSWTYERTRWLDKHFSIPKNRIIHTVGKEFIAGDCLIDDKVDNLIKWKKRHPTSLAILWEAPYNRMDQSPLFVKASTWNEVVDAINSL